jgi:glycosyltransferase involved in cell wall biosynthesis
MIEEFKILKTIALIEYHQGGHHTTYLRFLSKALLELGYQVMVFSSQLEEIEEWINHNCPNYLQQFHIFSIQPEGRPMLPIISKKLPTFLAIFERWFYAAAIIRKASLKIGSSPNLVFFNCLDGYFSRYLPHQIVDSVFPYNWSGLSLQAGLELLRQRPLPILSNYLYFWTATQSPRCHAIAVLDRETARQLENKIQKPVITFPDFADESPFDPDYIVAKQILELAHGRKIVGLIGSLTKRKGLLTLLKVAEQLVDKDFFFVFAGRLYKDTFSDEEFFIIKNVDQASLDNCFFHLDQIPDEPQFNALINSLDILFSAYENFPNSSNILTKAAVFKKPIIVSEGFCMGERVKKFNLGVTIPERNVSKCIEALYYLRTEINMDIHKSKFGFEQYQLLNSPQKLQEALSQIIEMVS